MKLLFVCSRNKERSPTAEKTFDGFDGHLARSAGTDKKATNSLTLEMIEWADLVFVMEKHHRNKIHKLLGSKFDPKKIINLEISDDYDCMDHNLIYELKLKVLPYLRVR